MRQEGLINVRHEISLGASSTESARAVRLPLGASVEFRLQGRWISATVEGASLIVDGVDGEPVVRLPTSLLAGLPLRWLDGSPA